MINVLSKFSFHANREESLWKRKEAEHGHSIFKRGHDCPKDIYYCPDTLPLVMTPGNPSTGEELFRKGYFDDVCRYFLLIQSWLKLSCSLKMTQHHHINRKFVWLKISICVLLHNLFASHYDAHAKCIIKLDVNFR